jgi:hypothetical protein
MTLAEAEKVLQARKLQGPVSEPWMIFTDEKITLQLLPPGIAFGACTLADIYTVRPKNMQSVLYHGVGDPHHVRSPRLAFYHLWQQEAYVYELEKHDQMRQALAQLEGAAYTRRKDERYMKCKQDVNPYPEDFVITYGEIKSKPGPAIYWEGLGRTDESNALMQALKKGFQQLLVKFIAGKSQLGRFR